RGARAVRGGDQPGPLPDRRQPAGNPARRRRLRPQGASQPGPHRVDRLQRHQLADRQPQALPAGRRPAGAALAAAARQSGAPVLQDGPHLPDRRGRGRRPGPRRRRPAMNDTPSTDDLHLDVNHLPPEDAVARLIEHASGLEASDLFLTSNENHVAVAARHLGLLRLLSIVPTDLGRRCIAHIKAVAGMDVAEKRRPLDGPCIYQRETGPPLDLRINTLPTLYGEDVTMRILDRESRLLSLEELGLLRRDHNQLLSLLNSPSGLLLVTGPTGSGKTTTLYACLSFLNNGERKINTIEDPIEYAIEGIRQSRINPRIDLGYPELLPAGLRQSRLP